MAKPRVIYVAGPLSAPTPEGVIANAEAAMHAGARLRDAGFGVILPHLCVWWDKKFPAPYETWLAMDLALLERCDALVRLAPSPGTDREVEHAIAHKIAVYFSIDDLLLEAAA